MLEDQMYNLSPPEINLGLQNFTFFLNSIGKLWASYPLIFPSMDAKKTGSSDHYTQLHQLCRLLLPTRASMGLD